MNWLDIVLLILLLWSVVSAFRQGLSRELIGFVTVIAAFVLGTWLYGTVAFYLQPYLSSRSLAGFAGFVIVFCGVMLVGGAVGMLVKRLMKAAGLSVLDRLMGAAFGLLRGLLVAIALVMAIMAFAPGAHPPRAVVNSRLAPYVIDSARVAAAIAPYELKEGFRKSYAEVKTIWGNALKRGIQALPSQAEGK